MIREFPLLFHQKRFDAAGNQTYSPRVQASVIRVPATTSNLGPGFDALGVALNLYNYVSIAPADDFSKDPFMTEISDAFFKTSRRKPQPFSVQIKGDVPRSSGLGSSVTVRLGLFFALNFLHGKPLAPEKFLELTIQLEGHPDNAAPAFYGGFTAGSMEKHFRARVSPKLFFVAAIPRFELATNSARAILPPQVSRKDAAHNIQHAALITAAFASRQYEVLRGAASDCLHQPYRAKLIPGFEDALKAAEKAGALAAYLSGSGPTVMAMTLKNPQKIGVAMKNALEKASGSHVDVKVLKADNRGIYSVIKK
ncbi:MAG: homoserine kinase [bacterium]